ncbi:MAG: hypothetical protein A2Z42_04255 [Candidatus Woykebacteria bacterium RBG_19FT_COMBO_43_10]|uniref:Uncharacterized protein n=1 Tax=Candidatus Woykebacteria bacterium RBG_19FT_COMBO_43_10 TaxID=1802598 RepID=A0A1G1WL44_9BACT|nr:MAG: hypothetical protein A2Z42_04255 [Candidatus Woykebacteria bacterium RBG_19FT_COMBO_43_10]
MPATHKLEIQCDELSFEGDIETVATGALSLTPKPNQPILPMSSENDIQNVLDALGHISTTYGVLDKFEVTKLD